MVLNSNDDKYLNSVECQYYSMGQLDCTYVVNPCS